MTDRKKTTKASAVELDESDLDQAQGGATYDFAFKTMDLTSPTGVKNIGDIDGESRLTTDYLKLGDIDGESFKR